MATINEIKQQAAAVKNATQVGENTAERVGGALAGLADIAEQQDTELGKKFDKESVVQESGDAEDKVMSQKATTTAIADETTRAKAAEGAIIFDVSVYNNGAVFESIQALLSSSNLNTLIPTSYRRGGMAIRFIQGSEQSSDNKYVQYRLMSDTFNTTPANWQGVDDDPTAGSDNLVKSGGVFRQIAIDKHTFVTVNPSDGSLKEKLYTFSCEEGKTYILYSKTTGTKWTHHVYLQNNLDFAQASRLQDVQFFASSNYSTTEFTCNVAGGTKYILLSVIENGEPCSVEFFIVEKNSIIGKVKEIELNLPKIEEEIETVASNEAKIKNFIGFNPYNFNFTVSSELPAETLCGKLYTFSCEQGKTYVMYHKTKGTDWTHYVYLQNVFDQSVSSRLQSFTFYKSEDYKATEFTCNVEGGTKYIYMNVWSTGVEGQVDFFIVEKDSIIDKVEELRTNGVDLSKIEAEIDDVRKGLYGSSIFDVNKKQYFKNLFIQANWASRNCGNTPHISPLVMLWFSDIHGSQYNYNRLIEFKNYFNEYIQASICTGDIVNNNYGDDFSYFTANDIMLVIGNHDVQDSTTGEHTHIGLEAYNTYFKDKITNWGVIQPDNAATEGLCYYYKDFTDRGIRLIVLDKMAWNSAQNTWLKGVLTDAKNNNLAVICANHYPANNTNLNRDCSFCSLYTNEIGGMPVDAINSIQSFIDNEHGEFICHISGHTHADYYGIIDGTTQLSITIDCAYCNYDAWNDSDRVVGEKSADCFNILSIDTYDKILKLFRVGVDRDRWLRHKGTMCLKYDTRELLWND